MACLVETRRRPGSSGTRRLRCCSAPTATHVDQTETLVVTLRDDLREAAFHAPVLQNARSGSRVVEHGRKSRTQVAAADSRRGACSVASSALPWPARAGSGNATRPSAAAADEEPQTYRHGLSLPVEMSLAARSQAFAHPAPPELGGVVGATLEKLQPTGSAAACRTRSRASANRIASYAIRQTQRAATVVRVASAGISTASGSSASRMIATTTRWRLSVRTFRKEGGKGRAPAGRARSRHRRSRGDDLQRIGVVAHRLLDSDGEGDPRHHRRTVAVGVARHRRLRLPVVERSFRSATIATTSKYAHQRVKAIARPSAAATMTPVLRSVVAPS